VVFFIKTLIVEIIRNTDLIRFRRLVIKEGKDILYLRIYTVLITKDFTKQRANKSLKVKE